MHRVEKIARENQKMVIPQSPDIIAVDQNRLEIN
jgi:cell division protein FtsL